MFLVLFLCAVMWGIGWVMGAPKSQRAIMVGVLLAGVILIQLVLPDGHPLREATGSSPGLWLLLAGFVEVVVLGSEVLLLISSFVLLLLVLKKHLLMLFAPLGMNWAITLGCSGCCHWILVLLVAGWFVFQQFRVQSPALE